MAGLIQGGMSPEDEMPEDQQQMPAEPGAEQMPPAADAGGEEDINSQNVRSKFELPPEMAQAYERVVQAGMRVMFGPEFREQTVEFMEGDGEPAEKLGEGVAAVMAMLFQESNGTMPPQIVVPAGIELLMHAVDVARSGGMQVSRDDVAEAIGTMVEAVFRQFGASMDDVQGMGAQPQGGQPPAGPQGGVA